MEVIIKTTDACNARCVYCSAHGEPTRKSRLTTETVRTLYEQMVALIDEGRIKQGHFLWHGGEPLLLGKDFFRKVASFSRDDRVSHRMQTNLTLIDRQWIEVLEPLMGKKGIGSSIDPFDQTRCIGDSSETYNRKWLEALSLLDEADWRVGTVYVVHKHSITRAADVYWFFRNLRDNGKLSLRVNPLLRVGRAEEAVCDDIGLSPGDYGRFLIDLTATWLSDHKRLTIAPLRDLVRAWAGAKMRSCDLAGRDGCMAARIGIDPAGNVYNCGRAVDADGLKFGTLGEVSLADCLDHPARQTLFHREDVLKADGCGRCRYWRFCHGGCPYESHTSSETAHRPTAWCEDYKQFFAWLETQLGPPAEEVTAKAKPVSRDKPKPPQPQAESEPVLLAWDIPPRWLSRVSDGRLHVRVTSEGDLDEIHGGEEPRSNDMVILPTTLMPTWLDLVPSDRPRVARVVLDQPADTIDERVVDHLVARRVPLLIRSGHGCESVEALARAGIVIIVDRLRDWSPGDLEQLAEFFLHDLNLQVPVEPFYSALTRLSPRTDRQARGVPTLRDLYLEQPSRHRYVGDDGGVAVSRVHAEADISLGEIDDLEELASPALATRPPLDSPCAVCAAYKSCRRFWLEPVPAQDHCSAWQRIYHRLGEATAVAANTR